MIFQLNSDAAFACDCRGFESLETVNARCLPPDAGRQRCWPSNDNNLCLPTSVTRLVFMSDRHVSCEDFKPLNLYYVLARAAHCIGQGVPIRELACCHAAAHIVTPADREEGDGYGLFGCSALPRMAEPDEEDSKCYFRPLFRLLRGLAVLSLIKSPNI
jgi:hypothetical protein